MLLGHVVVELCAPRIYIHPELQNVILFVNKVFADVIN